MARPSTIDELPETNNRILVATFELPQFSDRPKMVRAYADFTELVTYMGGEIVREHGGVRAYRPATVDELDLSLRSAQSSWDQAAKWYLAASEGETVPSYAWYSIKRHAESEGLAPLVQPEKAEEA